MQTNTRLDSSPAHLQTMWRTTRGNTCLEPSHTLAKTKCGTEHAGRHISRSTFTRMQKGTLVGHDMQTPPHTSRRHRIRSAASGSERQRAAASECLCATKQCERQRAAASGSAAGCSGSERQRGAAWAHCARTSRPRRCPDACRVPPCAFPRVPPCAGDHGSIFQRAFRLPARPWCFRAHGP